MSALGSDITIGSGSYLPEMADIIEIKDVTAREKMFKLRLPRPLQHRPGQFVMVSVLGIGEAPISITCGPRDDTLLELTIRRAGRLTEVFHRLKEGEQLGIRGPFGSGFQLDEFHNRDVLFVAGGLGLAPLRSLIQPVVNEPTKTGNITLVTGCRTPAEELYRDDLETWSAIDGVQVLRSVDRDENMPWSGRVGLVTESIAELDLDPERTTVAMCGPPVMYKFVLMALGRKNISHDRIFVDLERRMKCGVGKCGHCQLGHKYCCQDGPVFRYSDLQALPEAL